MKKIGYIPIEESSLYFSSADMVVLPYRNVYQSGILFLSYAHSRPVIAANVGGLPEVVEDGKSGFIVEPDNPEELADKINLAFSPNANLTEMGKYGFQMANMKFSWQSAAEKTYNFYNTLLFSSENRQVPYEA
ncbi:MAG: glycosyltransferase, partial [bacterium]